jgi:3-deoxy-D-manno-octulosonate 8-phosphate phosphatase (KDO 8-P phosphatase)
MMNEEKLRKIKLLLLDVDGVLTDGKIVYTDRGEEIKFFDVRDGHGLKLLMRAGIEVALVTGRESKVVEHRAKDLGITSVYQKVWDKGEILTKVVQEKGISEEAIAFMGDDLIDLPVLERVGFSATVADGADDVKERVDYVSPHKGGERAVREICELILKAQGKWDEVTKRYFLRENPS